MVARDQIGPLEGTRGSLASAKTSFLSRDTHKGEKQEENKRGNEKEEGEKKKESGQMRKLRSKVRETRTSSVLD